MVVLKNLKKQYLTWILINHNQSLQPNQLEMKAVPKSHPLAPRDLQRLGLLGELQFLIKRLFNLPLKIIISYMQWIRSWANPQYLIFEDLS